jgi:hypothetical protein
MKSSLPLAVAAATLGTFYINIRGFHYPPEWYLTIMCPWRIIDNDREVLSNADEGEEDSDEPLSWMKGLTLIDVLCSTPDGDNPVFIFDGGLRIEAFPDFGFESYMFHANGMTFPYFKSAEQA